MSNMRFKAFDCLKWGGCVLFFVWNLCFCSVSNAAQLYISIIKSDIKNDKPYLEQGAASHVWITVVIKATFWLPSPFC